MTYLFYITSIGMSAILGWFGILSKKINSTFYYIVYAVTFSFCDDLVARYFRFKFHNNSWVVYIANPFEYMLFALFIFHNTKNSTLRKVIQISSVCIFVYFVINAFTVKSIFPSSIIIMAITGFDLAACSIMFLWSLFESSQYFKLNVPLIIIIAGMLFYYSFASIFFSILVYVAGAPAKYLDTAVKIKVREFNALLAITNIMMYSSITIALIICMLESKNVTKKTSGSL